MAVDEETLAFWDCHRLTEKFTGAVFLDYLTMEEVEDAQERVYNARPDYKKVKHKVPGESKEEKSKRKAQKKEPRQILDRMKEILEEKVAEKTKASKEVEAYEKNAERGVRLFMQEKVKGGKIIRRKEIPTLTLTELATLRTAFFTAFGIVDCLWIRRFNETISRSCTRNCTKSSGRMCQRSRPRMRPRINKAMHRIKKAMHIIKVIEVEMEEEESLQIVCCTCSGDGNW